jgi:small-conductance mechanosensitive channel
MDFLDWKLFSVGSYSLQLGNLLAALLVMVAARALYLILKRTILKRYFHRRGVDEGRQFAVSQLIKYVLYLVSFLVAIEVAGIKITVLYAAGAALLVGVGIGLQQTFNDFMSGIILLTEGSIKKGDWLQLDDMEGRVLKIGPRTSTVLTRRRIAVIVPNSKITNENVINMSSGHNFIRYWISVGVAYGSDTRLVQRILIDCAREHAGIRDKPSPFVRFTNFGDSSLDFELHFWSDQMQRIVDIQSDLRFAVDQRFRENKIKIPFPQRELTVPKMEVNMLPPAKGNGV